MDKQEIFNKVKEILNTLGYTSVVFGSDFESDLGMDSLAITSFLMSVEDEYMITLDSDTFDNVRTVAGLVKYLEKTLKA